MIWIQSVYGGFGNIENEYEEPRDGHIFDRDTSSLTRMKKGHWSTSEDAVIVEQMGKGASWNEVVRALGGKRTTKQCRERWSNHLDPTLKKTKWTDEEDQYLIDAQARLGNSWTRIASELPGRSENEVKNRWYSSVHKQSSGRKRKSIDRSDSDSLPPSDDDTEEVHDSQPNDPYQSLDQEVCRLIEDVQLFLRKGNLESTMSKDDEVYGRLGRDYIHRQLYSNAHHRCDMRESTATTKESHLSYGASGTSSSSVAFDLNALKDAQIADFRVTSGCVSPGSFMVGFSMNPSPTWFGLQSQSSSPPEVNETSIAPTATASTNLPMVLGNT